MNIVYTSLFNTATREFYKNNLLNLHQHLENNSKLLVHTK